MRAVSRIPSRHMFGQDSYPVQHTVSRVRRREKDMGGDSHMDGAEEGFSVQHATDRKTVPVPDYPQTMRPSFGRLRRGRHRKDAEKRFSPYPPFGLAHRTDNGVVRLLPAGVVDVLLQIV